MISDILKKQTGYHLVNPQQIISKCIKVQIEKLVEKEIRSSTKGKKNDFKMAIETFAEQIRIMTRKIEDSI